MVDESAVRGHDLRIVSRLVFELAGVGNLLGDEQVVDRLFLHRRCL